MDDDPRFPLIATFITATAAMHLYSIWLLWLVARDRERLQEKLDRFEEEQERRIES